MFNTAAGDSFRRVFRVGDAATRIGDNNDGFLVVSGGFDMDMLGILRNVDSLRVPLPGESSMGKQTIQAGPFEELAMLTSAPLVALCFAFATAVSFDCSATGMCAVILDEDAVAGPFVPAALQQVAADRLKSANEWHFSVENIQAHLAVGDTVLLVFHNTSNVDVWDAVLEALQHAATGTSSMSLFVYLAHAPKNPFLRTAAYYWDTTTAAVSWFRERGEHQPPFLAVQQAPIDVNGVQLPFAVVPFTPTEMPTFLSGAMRLRQASRFQPRDAVRACPVPGKLRWYLYPDDGVTGTMSTLHATIREQLASSSQATTDPKEACFFIAPFDTTPLSPLVRGALADFGTNGCAQVLPACFVLGYYRCYMFGVTDLL